MLHFASSTTQWEVAWAPPTAPSSIPSIMQIASTVSVSLSQRIPPPEVIMGAPEATRMVTASTRSPMTPGYETGDQTYIHNHALYLGLVYSPSEIARAPSAATSNTPSFMETTLTALEPVPTALRFVTSTGRTEPMAQNN
ncbi:hypothetical protein RHS03_09122, partial [Rhizoctonia solani]